MTRDRYAKNAGAVFNLKYHVVWRPKYRRPVLVPPIDEWLRDIFNQVAAEHGFLLPMGALRLSMSGGVAL
jgi:REP element-mobilizing transposase RayT